MKKIIIFFLLINTAAFCYSQKIEKTNRLAVGFGVGTSNYGGTFGTNWSVKIKKGLFSGQYLYSPEFPWADKSNLTMHNLGLLYGLYAEGEGLFASASVGISYFVNQTTVPLTTDCIKKGGAKDPDCGRIREGSIGLPFEAQLIIKGKRSGVGIYGFANLNNQFSYIGAMITVQFYFF